MNKASSILLSITLVITGFATLVLGSYIVYAIGITTNPDWEGVAASGNLSFSAGNISNNETVNITSFAGVTTSFCFATSNISTDTVPTWCHNVTLFYPFNSSDNAFRNLTSAINNNATTAAYVTATNGTNNYTLLTADTVGRNGNYIRTTETLANASWSNGATLTGGKDIVYGQTSTINYAGIVLPLIGLLLMVVGFVFLLASVRGFNMLAGKNYNINSKTGIRDMYTHESSERSSSSDDERG